MVGDETRKVKEVGQEAEHRKPGVLLLVLSVRQGVITAFWSEE